jgi:hypothetical protein
MLPTALQNARPIRLLGKRIKDELIVIAQEKLSEQVVL